MIINPQHLARLLMVFGMLVFANAPAATKNFALHQAVLDDDKQLVVRLLNKGAAIDVIGSRKYGYGSALHLAVREGHLEIAKSLLRRGAEVDVLDPDDFTPLHNAAWNGNLEMTELLLDAGADINATTYDGDTPLSLAQNNDQAQVAEFIQARLQASLVVDTKVESVPVSDPGVIDISGTYISEITQNRRSGYYPPRYYFSERSRIEVEIEQNGSAITGIMSGDRTGVVKGAIKGKEIIFEWEMEVPGSSIKYGEGKWVISDDHNILNGTWKTGYGGHDTNGSWNLTRIEPVDFTGTYIADISGERGLLGRLLLRSKSTEVRKVIITQSGSQITGTYDDGKGKIYGEIKGDTIVFSWTSHDFYSGGGKWTHVPESNGFVGRFEYEGGGGTYMGFGEWNLTKIE